MIIWVDKIFKNLFQIRWGIYLENPPRFEQHSTELMTLEEIQQYLS